MFMKNKHVVIISENPDASWNYQAMFKAVDTFSINLRERTHKTLEKYEGTFKRDSSVKGWKNGQEIGIFTSTSNKKFVVFSDHSVAEYK